MAEVNGNQLESESKQVAAISLRIAYGQALEALFATIFAAIQAPKAVVGWLLHYRDEAAELTKKIIRNEPILTRIDLTENSWKGIVEAIHQPFKNQDVVLAKTIQDRVVKLWSFLARDFVNELRRDEYNSMKHGLRVSPGSSKIEFEIAGNDEAPSLKDRIELGGNGFGSHYFSIERFGKGKTHFVLANRSMNWHPDNMVASLILISMSLSNIQTFLQVKNNKFEGEFTWPAEEELFERATKLRHGLSQVNFTQNVEFAAEGQMTDDDILATYG